MLDLHRHDEFSLFDGFGKAEELAKLAKAKGYTALGTSNHGNANGIVKTWEACLKNEIKPVLGIEGYFLPKYKDKHRGFHLCAFAKNAKGYRNLNELHYKGELQKYYNSIWTFDLLEEFSEGLIVSSACVAGYSARCIANGDIDKARRYFEKMQSIFGEDFYIEIQPYTVSEPGLQELVNVESIKLGNELGIPLILTSDSHRGAKEDFLSYLKMHEIAGHDVEWIETTYKDRYMPDLHEMRKRFYKMHREDFGDKEAKRLALEMESNLELLESSVDWNIFEGYEMTLPSFVSQSGATKVSSSKKLVQEVKAGLKKRHRTSKEYVERAKFECEVINELGYEDYFLMVQDYTAFAKQNGIAVGPGRGSGCNSIVCYALGITEVDSIKYGLEFSRFLRKDKKKMPDIDLDFETSRRPEVIRYLVDKYDGHSARICSYGTYKVDNLMNDLAKACMVGDFVDDKFVVNKNEVAALKRLVRTYQDDGEDGFIDRMADRFKSKHGFVPSEDEKVDDLHVSYLMADADYAMYNEKYDDILLHFIKLYHKVRFVGTHAAGVAITGDDIFKFTTIRVDKNGDKYVAFDLDDLDKIKVTKFDILGLKTMEELRVLREATGNNFSDDITEDESLIEAFGEGRTTGIFQYDTRVPMEMLKNVHADCFDDVVAVSAMNRPGPLSLGMPSIYQENKLSHGEIIKDEFWEYTKETYGTLIYQEQIQQICVNVAGLPWSDADAIMKLMKANAGALTARRIEQEGGTMRKRFIEGAVKNGIAREDASSMFEKMMTYSFNKGHGVGYALISFEEMFYKVYYPSQYWYVKLKYAKDEAQYRQFCEVAVSEGNVIFLPHVNYSLPGSSLRSYDGEEVIQQGLAEIKNVGDKAAMEIANERALNGIFKSYDDFYDRCKSRLVTKRVIDALQEAGALEFKKKIYVGRVVKYNSALYAKAIDRASK